jgi:pimeloyl-ACP methyl ester carboxylesterase
MIHGMCVLGSFWDNFKLYFESAGYNCLAPDLPLHRLGEPDPRLGTIGLDQYVNSMAKIVNTLSEPPIVFGHSMGGLLAQLVACQTPVRALVLIAPATPRGIIALTPSVLACFAEVLVKPVFWEKPFRFSRLAAFRYILNCLPVETAETIYHDLVYESGRAAAEIGLWFLDLARATEIDYSKLRIPILMMAGSKDRITPLRPLKKLVQKLPSASYYEYPENGHMLTMETGWQQKAELILDWLKAPSPTLELT